MFLPTLGLATVKSFFHKYPANASYLQFIMSHSTQEYRKV